MAINRSVPCLNLAKIRERKGITLEQIADTTKISIRFLRAIESEEFDQLPGGIFNTSYLRQYALVVGYEESSLLTFYNNWLGVEGQTDEGSRRPAERNRSRNSIWPRSPAPLF